MIWQYRVTYDSSDEMFVVHHESTGLPNMEFKMHKSGLHVFYPDDIKDMVMMYTVTYNMQAFIKRDIEGAKQANQIYAKLLYHSNADFWWMVQNNHIKNCEVSVRNIDKEQYIWGKDIDALKGKTVRGKPKVVSADKSRFQKK